MKKHLKVTLSLGDFLVIAVAIVAAVFMAEMLPFREVFRGKLFLPAEPPQPRSILFTDWVVDDGNIVWVTGAIEDGYLRMIPGRLWASMDLREEVLEDSKEYRWLEMEIYAPPQSEWKLLTFVYYEDLVAEDFEISPVVESLENNWPPSSFDYRIIVSSDGWVTVRLPLKTAEFGRIRNLSLISGRAEVEIRNITLVP